MSKAARSRPNLSLCRDAFLILMGACLATMFSTYQQAVAFYDGPLLHLPAQEVPSDVERNNNAGWNPIHVFYGQMNHITDPIPDDRWIKDSPKHQGKQWFAQHGQDIAVAKAHNFKSSGYFIDLAANDAVWASNTFSLEQNFGWKGICIEANPIYWNRLSFRKCHVVGAIVGSKDFEEVEVSLGNDQNAAPLGGIVGAEFDNKKASKPEKKYTASLRTILQKFDAPNVIDYLSLDVEGAETFIMRDFAWDEYIFLTMTIERPSEELQQILVSHGYNKVMDIRRGDTLWAHITIFEQAMANVEVNTDEIHKHEVAAFPAQQLVQQS